MHAWGGKLENDHIEYKIMNAELYNWRQIDYVLLLKL